MKLTILTGLLIYCAENVADNSDGSKQFKSPIKGMIPTSETFLTIRPTFQGNPPVLEVFLSIFTANDGSRITRNFIINDTKTISIGCDRQSGTTGTILFSRLECPLDSEAMLSFQMSWKPETVLVEILHQNQSEIIVEEDFSSKNDFFNSDVFVIVVVIGCIVVVVVFAGIIAAIVCFCKHSKKQDSDHFVTTTIPSFADETPPEKEVSMISELPKPLPKQKPKKKVKMEPKPIIVISERLPPTVYENVEIQKMRVANLKVSTARELNPLSLMPSSNLETETTQTSQVDFSVETAKTPSLLKTAESPKPNVKTIQLQTAQVEQATSLTQDVAEKRKSTSLTQDVLSIYRLTEKEH